MTSLVLPPHTSLRVIPDVHGEAEAFARCVNEARAEGRFILQLGDMVDRGPDSVGALTLMLDLMDAGAGLMLMGNHDWKIVRALQGRPVKLGPDPERTLREIAAEPGLSERLLSAAERMPFHIRHADRLFVHGAWHPAMTSHAPLDKSAHDHVLSRALYGQTTGKRDPKGRPERVWDWVDELPAGLEVVVGHDWRGPCVVLRRTGAGGGSTVLMDLGCGKGGPLAWMDIDAQGAARFSHPVASWTGATFALSEMA